MDSLISAAAAKVIFIQGTEFSFVEAEKPGTRIRTTSAAIPYLLADADDVVTLKNTTVAGSFQRLLEDWNSDRALRMLDIMLDIETPSEEANEAAQYFSALITNGTTETYVKNRAFMIPIPDRILFRDITDKLKDFDVALAFVKELFEVQSRIAQVRSAWDMISETKFDGPGDRLKFEFAAMETGTFRKLVESLGDQASVNSAVLECYLKLRSQKNARAIISDWTKELVDRPVRRKLTRLEAHEEAQDQAEVEDNRPEGSVHEIYTYTRKRQVGVISQLERGNLNQARRFANQLIDWQLKNGGPEYAAMSLCLLAQEAKHLSQSSLQLEWVQQALELSPDAQAHGQAGDAYLSLFRLDEAEREYAATIAMGDELFGLTGLARVLRARGMLDDALKASVEIETKFGDDPEIHWTLGLKCEILREMWRLEEALVSYREYAGRFPNHSSFICGVASVLKDMGSLTEALECFTAAAAKFPDEPVARGGRADALKLLGRIDEAMQEYDSAIAAFPWQPALISGKADVLRTAGRYEEAAACYRSAMVNFPNEPVSYCGYADTKRDAGEIEDALQAYDDAVQRFRSDHRCRTGRANVLRQAGRYEEALQAMDRNVRDFPYDLYSLMGRANLLKLLGSHSDALEAYQTIIDRRRDYAPAMYGKAAVHISLRQFGEADSLLPKNNPTTLSEWVGFHIRGMMHLKKGELADAVRIFDEGVARNPYHKQRVFFKTSLAAAKIRLGQFSQAIDLADAPDDPVAQVLRMHSLAALNRSNEALAVYSAANDNVPPPVIRLRDAIAARFGLSISDNRPGEQWILDQEAEVLLQAA